MKTGIKIYGLIVAISFLISCRNSGSDQKSKQDNSTVLVLAPAPDFDNAAAFVKVKTQVDFGDRVPGTAAHKACGDWIINTLKEADLEVIEQPFDAFSYKGERRKSQNIIGVYNPAATKRILLAAHWDTREVADQDDERKEEAIPGANDGGSGVAVLLQIAQSIREAAKKPDVGIDFVFFDAEDGGTPEGFAGKALNEYGGYCMGSDYWSKNPHKANYSAYYGILLDMVGAKGATFRKEQLSVGAAPSVVDKIWGIAAARGFDNYFLNDSGGGLTDDHVPVIRNRKIPMIDIVDLKNLGGQTFFDHWHTHEDDLAAIDAQTLEAVGETLLQALYNESGAPPAQ